MTVATRPDLSETAPMSIPVATPQPRRALRPRCRPVGGILPAGLGFEVVQGGDGRTGGLSPGRRGIRQPSRPRALFAVGPGTPSPPAGSVGLYHLAWQVASIHDLAAGRSKRSRRWAGRYAGQSDHGATKSLYGRDPDGNEFEIMWMLPAPRVGRVRALGPVAPLDIEAEVARWGSEGAARA